MNGSPSTRSRYGRNMIRRPTLRSIVTAYHYVRVQRGLALIQGEVTHHRRHFDLPIDRVLAIHCSLDASPRGKAKSCFLPPFTSAVRGPAPAA